MIQQKPPRRAPRKLSLRGVSKSAKRRRRRKDSDYLIIFENKKSSHKSEEETYVSTFYCNLEIKKKGEVIHGKLLYLLNPRSEIQL